MAQQPLVDIDGDVVEYGFEVLLTPRDAASILGVQVRTVSNWAKQGRLRFVVTNGGHKRYYADSVRAAFRGDWETASDPNRRQADMSPADVHQVVDG